MASLEALRASIQTRTRELAKANVDAETSSVRIKEIRDTLKEDFGVSSGAEYQQVMEQLRVELEASLAEVEGSLTKAERSG